MWALIDPFVIIIAVAVGWWSYVIRCYISCKLKGKTSLKQRATAKRMQQDRLRSEKIKLWRAKYKEEAVQKKIKRVKIRIIRVTRQS